MQSDVLGTRAGAFRIGGLGAWQAGRDSARLSSDCAADRNKTKLHPSGAQPHNSTKACRAAYDNSQAKRGRLRSRVLTRRSRLRYVRRSLPPCVRRNGSRTWPQAFLYPITSAAFQGNDPLREDSELHKHLHCEGQVTPSIVTNRAASLEPVTPSKLRQASMPTSLAWKHLRISSANLAKSTRACRHFGAWSADSGWSNETVSCAALL